LKETTFGVDEDVIDTSPAVTPGVKETTFDAPQELQWAVEFDSPNLMEEPQLLQAPPVPPKPAVAEPLYASVKKDRPLRSSDTSEPSISSRDPPQRYEPPQRLDSPETVGGSNHTNEGVYMYGMEV
jgi:hypothetical protein